jgi:4-hydroxy-2-oxoheptanedioate aldolase
VQSLVQRIAAKGHVLNAYLTIPSSFVAEIVAATGFDAVTLDMQHGVIGYDAALPILTALATRDVVPMARTEPLNAALIMKLLDAGVLGITCASVESAEQARKLVAACRYPLAGERSFGPARAALLYPSYAERAVDLVTIFAMIESVPGLRNLDGILAVNGLDGIYIGPYDLAMSMGLPPTPDGRFPAEVEGAVDEILLKTRDCGLICGMLAPNGKAAAALVARGFQFVTVSNDLRALQGTLKGWLDDFARERR